jgi:hypothetical protein
MLEEMRFSTDKLRNVFWEQEKKIEYLRRDLAQTEDTKRVKEKEQKQLKMEREALERTLKGKKAELAIEKDNEAAIMRH